MRNRVTSLQADLAAKLEQDRSAGFGSFDSDLLADFFGTNLFMSRSARSETGQEITRVLTKVMCLSRASPVSASTLSGSVMTICTSSGSSPQAARQSRIACTKIKDDQATFSDGLTTIAFPVASAAIVGEIKLSMAGRETSSVRSVAHP